MAPSPGPLAGTPQECGSLNASSHSYVSDLASQSSHPVRLQLPTSIDGHLMVVMLQQGLLHTIPLLSLCSGHMWCTSCPSILPVGLAWFLLQLGTIPPMLEVFLDKV